jgi:FixJ family two-component response regulator
MSPAPLIHVVDDDELLRTALLRLLEAAGFEARGYASTGDFLLHAALERPGCLLLDLNLPGPSGLELQEELQRRGMTLPVIFLTGRGDIPASVRAMKAGASDFLTKPVEGSTLLQALQRAMAQAVTERATQDGAEQLRARFALLTRREREVFELVVTGKLNKQIASELGIGERTVKLQRAQAMAKLGVSSAAELGVLAERLRRLGG